MTRPLPLITLVLAALACAAPATATAAGWTPPQELGPSGFASYDTAIASNASGDAVTAFSQSRGMYIARASAGAPFGTALRMDSEGLYPRIAIDARGVALIAWEYDDGSFSGSDGFRGTVTCCTGTKVVVWRPGQAPSPVRVVRRRGLVTRPGPVAAVSGRRGILVRAAGSDEEQLGTMQFVPIRVDGRPGKRRAIGGVHWSRASLQYSGGRAVVGLIDPRGPSRLALRTQRANGSFGPLRVFLRVPEALIFYELGGTDFNDAQIVPDGRGGQAAVLERGARPHRYLQLVRKRRGAAARTIARQRGRADDFDVSQLSASPDGWTALAYMRRPAITSLDGVVQVVAVSPRGRIRSTPLTPLGDFSSPAVSVTRGGAGAAGFSGRDLRPGGPYRSASSFAPIRGGRPLPAGALLRNADGLIGNVVMTSNPRDRARVVWEEGQRVFASRLE